MLVVAEILDDDDDDGDEDGDDEDVDKDGDDTDEGFNIRKRYICSSDTKDYSVCQKLESTIKSVN